MQSFRAVEIFVRARREVRGSFLSCFAVPEVLPTRRQGRLSAVVICFRWSPDRLLLTGQEASRAGGNWRPMLETKRGI
jgi:hypothetical protein